MKRLKVKTLYQAAGSLDCGPICVRMILEYFGVEKTEKELKKNLFYEEEGTYIYDNGILFLEEHLKTTLITANPLLFEKEVQGKLKSKETLFKHISKYARKKPNKKKAVGLLKKYVSQGGKVKIEIPIFEHIKNAIDSEKPVMALLYAKALGVNEGGFHFVVVSGYKKDHVYINNPGPKARTGWFPTEDFMYALYSSTCFDIDNGSLLVVGK